MTQRHVSTREAAKACGLAASSLRRWGRTGVLKPAFVTPGGHMRWDVDDLRRQVEAMQR